MPDLIVPTRRVFLGVLAGLVAAPMVVRATSLMPIRGETLVRPKVDLLLIRDYIATHEVQVDVLYGTLRIEPEWSVIGLDDYTSRVLAPMVDRLQGKVADLVMAESMWMPWRGHADGL